MSTPTVAPLTVPASPGPTIGSLFTGVGGLDLGVLDALGGAQVAWCADNDPHVRAVLDARMPAVPNLGDLRNVTWHDVPHVDMITAGFPCQDISSFVVWVMGLPDGWVSTLSIPRTAQLRALGNGVVLQQAAHAARLLLADVDRIQCPCSNAGAT